MDKLLKDIAKKVMSEVYDVRKQLVEDTLYTVYLPKEGQQFNSISTVMEYSVNDIRYALCTSTDLDEILPLFDKLRDKDEPTYRALALCHNMVISKRFDFVLIGWDNHKKKPYVRGEVK